MAKSSLGVAKNLKADVVDGVSVARHIRALKTLQGGFIARCDAKPT